MAKAKRVKQLSFTIPNKTGLLSEITAAVAGTKANINAICAYEQDKRAYFLLIADSNAKARKPLVKLKIKAKEEDVVLVEMPNKIGELQKVSEKIADAGVNISYMYGTTGTGRSSVCVFQTSDNKKAVSVINK
jgi:hypothetical protein